MHSLNATQETIAEITRHIPTWMTDEEKVELFRLGKDVRPGEKIVEIGALYGGSTAILGLATQDRADVLVIDNFSWSPIPELPASKETLLKHLASVDLENVTVYEIDSLQCIYEVDGQEIALLWIDGGHSFEFIYHDLTTFGPHARVIACHDFDNPAWPTIRQAVERFIVEHPEWSIRYVVGQIVVLEKKA